MKKGIFIFLAFVGISFIAYSLGLERGKALGEADAQFGSVWVYSCIVRGIEKNKDWLPEHISKFALLNSAIRIERITDTPLLAKAEKEKLYELQDEIIELTSREEFYDLIESDEGSMKDAIIRLRDTSLPELSRYQNLNKSE